MIKDGFDLLTYRKGRCRRINARRFIRRRAEFDAGKRPRRRAGPIDS
jgi:hypothetical protein